MATGAVLAAVPCAGCGADDGGEAAGPTTTERPTASCFWSEPVTAEQNNTQYPDSGATYWFSAFTLPEGATLRLTGAYPHARYTSFNAYGPDPATGTDSLPIDALADVAIEPDEGSVNPFVAGADRTGADRSYAVTVVGEEAPDDADDRGPNTLYGRAPGSTPGGATDQQLIYRVYVPDEGRDLGGGAGLPTVEIEHADGEILTGDAACEAVGVDTVLHAEDLPALDEVAYRDLVALGDPATHPAFDPVEWHAFFNARQALLTTFWTNTAQEPGLAAVDSTRVGGFYSNADNSYVVAAVNRRLGPAPDGHNLLVLTGTAPSTPATAGGEATMAGGDLRYWSLCQNESPVTTRVSGCLYDKQVPVDADGGYTIVLGMPADRPENATIECGVAWLDWGPGDGVSRPEAGTLILRHLLPAAGFARTIAAVEAPGEEAEVLGDRLPTGTYTAPDDFAARGCPPSRVPVASRRAG